MAKPCINTEQLRKRRREYYQKHKKEINQKMVEKIHNTPELRIERNLRNRIRKALIKAKTIKSKKTLELLGCSFQEAKDYLQEQFREGMTWENYGVVWHIDHIIPCASFDLTDEEEQKKCFNFKNLQPLFVEENLKKSDILPDGTRGRYKKLILEVNNET